MAFILNSAVLQTQSHHPRKSSSHITWPWTVYSCQREKSAKGEEKRRGMQQKDRDAISGLVFGMQKGVLKLQQVPVILDWAASESEFRWYLQDRPLDLFNMPPGSCIVELYVVKLQHPSPAS